MSNDAGFKERGCSSNKLWSVHPKRPDSPEPSCVSMKSEQSMDKMIFLKDTNRSVHPKRPDSPEPSCVSMKSEQSMDKMIFLKDTNRSVHPKRPDSPEPSCVSMKSEQSMDKMIFLKDTNRLEQTTCESDKNKIFKSKQKKLFQCLYEGTPSQENPTHLNEIYTELYITEDGSEEISNEHEVRQIETASRKAATEDTPIQLNDIFKHLPGQDKSIRIVLTKGVAGIGKTVSVQKFILDWAEERANQDIHFIFPLPFRNLNLMKAKKLSFLDILQTFFTETKEMELSSEKYKIVLIFDGLDECRLSLDFQSNVKVSDITESVSVDVLLTNLIKGNLLPSALIWITSRPAAADLIPSECVHRVTEVKGFSEAQKEEYFRKRISDQTLANRIIKHLRSSRSLYTMCHIPVFCWISATVLERMLSEAESGEIPKTLTQMYTHFLIIQTCIKNEKDYAKKVKDEDLILALGKLAFQQLVKGNLIFYEEDLNECGIDVREASVYSGLCTQIFREESGLYLGKVFCFVHLSIQEHLAALYVHLSFKKNNINEFDQYTKLSLFSICLNLTKQVSLFDLHQRAVDESLDSKNGHLELFLRFLLGLSLKSNQTLLSGVLTQTISCSHNNDEIVQYIKQKIRKNPSPEKSINLFHCLNELGDHSLIQEIQHYLKSGTVRRTKLSSAQWSAIVFLLLTSEQEINVFQLNKYLGEKDKAHEVLLRLLPVVKASRSVQVISCGIKDKSCAVLASVLRSNPSNLRELDLSENKLKDSGVKLLSAGLESPECKLEILTLKSCAVTDRGCAVLTSALISNLSHLRKLNLSGNKLEDSGVKLLSAVLINSDCKMEILSLAYCGVKEKGCAALTSALRTNPFHLRELDLSGNKLGDSGVKLLSPVLENPHCKLEILRLENCDVTDGFAALISSVSSNPSHLRQLNMDGNKLGDSGVNWLSAVMKTPQCKLEKLRLMDCAVTYEGCTPLASALKSNPSHLRELNLSENKIGDSGVKLLSDAALENPDCKLEILSLWNCDITDEGCKHLASALKSNPSHLRELNLSRNKIGDSGVKLLSDLLENPHCKLEILRLEDCNITDKGCAALTSAMRSNHSCLKLLNLTLNYIGDSGMKLLSAIKEDSRYKLETLLF